MVIWNKKVLSNPFSYQYMNENSDDRKPTDDKLTTLVSSINILGNPNVAQDVIGGVENQL